MSPAFALQEWQVRLVLPHRPPVLQLDRVECVAGLGAIRATKALGGGDPMLRRANRHTVAQLAPGAVIEALAQCCGLLLRLRWLAAVGADLLAFAGGDDAQLRGRDIPRSVLADSHARFESAAAPGQLLNFDAQLVLSRGDMHRFRTTATGIVAAEISLKFPYTT